MLENTTLRIAAALAISLQCTMAFAHSGATGVVLERMEAMKDIAAQMKRIGAMIKGTREYDAALAASAAELIVEHAETMPSLFPEGSIEGPSEARPSIWADWSGFTRSADDLAAAASALSQAAHGASEPAGITPHFAAVGKTCSACHQDYRLAD